MFQWLQLYDKPKEAFTEHQYMAMNSY